MVAIITLNYNQNEFTLSCVESILESHCEEFKLFLIDNGSTAVNFEKLERSLPDDHRIKLHRIEKNVGYVGGINFGLEKSSLMQPQFYMILNNDTILDNKAVDELVQLCVETGNMAIVTGKVYHFDEPNKFQDIGYAYSDEKSLKFIRIGLDEEDTGQYDSVAERDMVDDVFWLFPSKLYKEIGGYSPYFWFSAEQADFAIRAKKKGYKLMYTPKAKIWHKGSVSLGGRDRNPKLAYWHMQSTLIFRFRNLSTWEFLKQYFRNIQSILHSYFKAMTSNNNSYNFDYPNAKFKGLMYFNKWYFLRNINTGENPFID